MGLSSHTDKTHLIFVDEDLLKAVGYYRPPSSCDEESDDNFYSLDTGQYKSPRDSPPLGEGDRSGSYDSVKRRSKLWRKQLSRKIRKTSQSTARKLKVSSLITVCRSADSHPGRPGRYQKEVVFSVNPP